jgi:hypothetical protein
MTLTKWIKPTVKYIIVMREYKIKRDENVGLKEQEGFNIVTALSRVFLESVIVL